MINRELLKEEGMYERIKDIWYNIEGKYKRVSPNPARVKWEEFKVQAYAALMEETKSRRKEARLASSNEAIAYKEFLLNYIQTSRPPPSKENFSRWQRVGQAPAVQDSWYRLCLPPHCR